MPAAQHVDVQVRDGLTAIGAVIDRDAEAGVADAFLAGDGSGGEQEVAKKGGVFRLGFADAGDHDFRDDEEMGGRLGADVAEGDALAVLVQDLRGDFPGDDAFENRHESWS